LYELVTQIKTPSQLKNLFVFKILKKKWCAGGWVQVYAGEWPPARASGGAV
jgi:hypothetical protein